MMEKRSDRAAKAERQNYSAPALEKGLDVMELLAKESNPLSVSSIVQRLGRSTGELFRMIMVLERRGFILQSDQGYILSPKLFELGLSRPPTQSLIEIALPIMRQLSIETNQSCHLVMPSRGDLVVVARMESRNQIGFSVRVGYRQPIYMTGSGVILYAFQPLDIRAEWEAMFDPKPSRAQLSEFRALADTVAGYGFARQPSAVLDGVIDLSAPIHRGGRAAAALALPYVRSRNQPDDVERVVQQLCAAAARISESLTDGDNRV